MKKDKHILYLGKDIPLRNLPWFEHDVRIEIYGRSLRIVRSEKKKDMEEPWYLLTNDFNSAKEKIIADYYFRFEIEETFKDLKHIFELNKFYSIKKKQSLLILLWFCILGIWVMWSIQTVKEFLTKRVTHNKHKMLSVTKFFFEQILLTRISISCMSP